MEKCYVIPTQKLCNCNCIMCITKTRCYDKQREFLAADNDLQKTIARLKNYGVKTFEITGGGEPFLNIDLKDIIKTIKMQCPESYVKLYTNGNILKQIDGIDELNISVIHYNTRINKSYMRANSKLSISDKLKYFRLHYPNALIRLSIPLMKGAIDTKQKLTKFIEITKQYNLKYVVRTLYPKTKNKETYYVDFEYSHELVKMEKELDESRYNNSVVLWSDGKLYTDFSLQTERN